VNVDLLFNNAVVLTVSLRHTTNMNQPPLILFDGICKLCTGWVLFLIRRDKKMKFRFASLQSETGRNRLIVAGLPVDAMDTVIYIRDEQYFYESTAVLEILNDLGGIWKTTNIFRLIPKAIRDSIYRFIARNRFKIFGRSSTCLVPTREIKDRFIS